MNLDFSRVEISSSSWLRSYRWPSCVKGGTLVLKTLAGAVGEWSIKALTDNGETISLAFRTHSQTTENRLRLDALAGSLKENSQSLSKFARDMDSGEDRSRMLGTIWPQ